MAFTIHDCWIIPVVAGLSGDISADDFVADTTDDTRLVCAFACEGWALIEVCDFAAAAFKNLAEQLRQGDDPEYLSFPTILRPRSATFGCEGNPTPDCRGWVALDGHFATKMPALWVDMSPKGDQQ